MAFSATFRASLARGNKIALRMDMDVPAVLRLHLTASSIAAASTVNIRMYLRDWVGQSGDISELIGGTSDIINAAFTEGSQFSASGTDADAGTAFAAAINASTDLSQYAGAVHVGSGIVEIRGRQGTAAIGLYDTGSGIPGGYTVLDELGRGRLTNLDANWRGIGPRRYSFTSADIFIGSKEPIIHHVAFGAQKGEPITREFSFDSTEVVLSRDAITKEIYRASDYYRQPVSIYLGVQTSGGWEWELVGSEWQIANWKVSNQGSTYTLVIEPLWGVLARTSLGGQFIHMHPLQVARRVLIRALGTVGEQILGTTPSTVVTNSLNTSVDTKRSHFSVTRARDQYLEEDPQTTVLGRFPGNLVSATNQQSNVETYMAWLDTMKRQEADSSLSEPEAVADILNQLALHMSGGFYEADGKIGFSPSNEGQIAGQEDFNLGNQGDIANPLDDIHVREVVVHYARFAKDVVKQTFKITLPLESTQGSEVALDLDWANGVSELRPPAFERANNTTFRNEQEARTYFEGYTRLYFSDTYFGIAYPSRGFCGARIRRTGASTYAIDSGEELDPTEDRVAYVKLITDGTGDPTGQSDLTASSQLEADQLDSGGGFFFWPDEIVVVDTYEATETSDVNQSTVDYRDSGFPPAPDSLSLTYLRHPYFPHHRDQVVGDPTKHIYNGQVQGANVVAEDFRNLTLMNLRARIDSDYSDDGAEDGRNAFATGREAIEAGASGAPPSTFGDVGRKCYMRILSGELSRFASLSTGFLKNRENSFGLAVDATIPIYVAKRTLERFGNGASVIEVIAPLQFGDVKMWDTIVLDAPEIDVPGQIGVTSDTVLWEVTGVQLMPLEEPAGVRLELTQLSTVAPVTPATFVRPALTPVGPVLPPLSWVPPTMSAGGSMLQMGGSANLDPSIS